MLDGNVSVRCDSEAARGFVVKSAVAKVTDLGTEFGAAVDADRQTDLHVFQGMVEVLRNSVENMEPFRMTAGQRVVFSPCRQDADSLVRGRRSTLHAKPGKC